jgi:hypothetical protein
MKTYKPFSLIMRDYINAIGLLSVHLMKMFQLQKIQDTEIEGEMIINSENMKI